MDPLSGFTFYGKQFCLSNARRWDDVIAASQESSASSFFYLESWLGAGYRGPGRFEEALLEYRRVEGFRGEPPLVGLALTYAGMGRSDDAYRILRRMEEKATNGYYPPAFIAGVYASLGDIESAVTLVQAAVEARDLWVAWVVNTTEAAELRKDPRVIQIMRHVGIPVRQ